MLMIYFLICLSYARVSCGSGLLLLYQPKDITNECTFSKHLRFDISFGMGMSDTITLNEDSQKESIETQRAMCTNNNERYLLNTAVSSSRWWIQGLLLICEAQYLQVIRTLNNIEYECLIEVVTSRHQYMLVVVRYPNAITSNCAVNRNAIRILKRNRCIRLCDLLDREVYSPYFIFTVKDRLRFLFKSNSTINSVIHANFYQVTITSARLAPKDGCNKRNETICNVNEENYCFTTGVVCDGIKNCGVDDWFDERKSLCSLSVERLGYAPVVAVMAALLCFMLAGGHILLRCLPSHGKSFFIFNANEDNRLCVDPVLKPHGTAPEIKFSTRYSIIPVGSLSTESEKESNTNEDINVTSEGIIKYQQKEICFQNEGSSTSPQINSEKDERKTTITQRLQEKLKIITKYALKGGDKNDEKEITSI